MNKVFFCDCLDQYVKSTYQKDEKFLGYIYFIIS